MIFELLCPLPLHGSSGVLYCSEQMWAGAWGCRATRLLPQGSIPSQVRKAAAFLTALRSEVRLRGLCCAVFCPLMVEAPPWAENPGFGCCHASSVRGWKFRDRDSPRRWVGAIPTQHSTHKQMSLEKGLVWYSQLQLQGSCARTFCAREAGCKTTELRSLLSDYRWNMISHLINTPALPSLPWQL